MKQIYFYRTTILVKLKDDSIVTIKGKASKWCYGDIPENKIQKYENSNTMFDDLCNVMNVKPSISPFSKKKYFNQETFFWTWSVDGTVKQDTIHSFVVYTNYNTGNPSIKALQKELTFIEYTELLFDREQDLKSALSALQQFDEV